MTARWQRPKSPWRDSPDFCELAQRLWPEDYHRAQKPGYDKGACQNLRLRWEGWRAHGWICMSCRRLETNNVTRCHCGAERDFVEWEQGRFTG